MTALVRIVLIDPSHPGNIGSVARAMKNMALSRPGAGAPALISACGSQSRWRRARTTFWRARASSRRVAEAISDCGFIAGTTSRPRSYYWEFTTPRDVAGRIVALPARKSRGAAVRLGALRARHRGFEPLQCAGAHSRQSRVLLAESRDVGAADRRTRSSWRASSRNRTRNWKWRWRRRAMSSTFMRTCTQVLERNRFRRSHRAPDGAACGACSIARSSTAMNSTSCAAS